MKDAVVIKSYPNGINLLLNSESSVDAIVAELSQKFTDSKSFFGKAKTAVSMEGKKLTDCGCHPQKQRSADYLPRREG